MRELRIQYNAPVVLTFSLLALGALLLGFATDGDSTWMLFSVYRSPLTQPLTYLRFFTHVLGHANYAHFINNIMLLLVIGPPMEEKYGSRRLLACIVLTFCIAGSYSTNNRLYDIYIILIFGIISYFLRRMDFQLVPILLGIVLGPLAEDNFRRALLLSDGSLSIFVTRPISLAFLLIAVGSIALFAWKNHKANART